MANEMEIGDRDDDAGVSRVPYSGADTVALTAYNAVEDRKKFVIDYYYSTPSVSIDTESAWGYTGYGLAALWKNDSAGNEYIIKACEDYPPAEGVQMTDTYFCAAFLLTTSLSISSLPITAIVLMICLDFKPILSVIIPKFPAAVAKLFV